MNIFGKNINYYCVVGWIVWEGRGSKKVVRGWGEGREVRVTRVGV
jgi:hypothetical protein